jgi:hypothetical protein
MKRSPLPLRVGLGWSIWLLALSGAACDPDPYGDFNDPSAGLGPYDPVSFPPANLGTGGDRKRPGFGRFNEIPAFVAGQPVGYFPFALPTLPAGSDPLRVLDDGKPYTPVSTPPAYVFDAAAGSPFPTDDVFSCNRPPGYVYDRRRDELDFSQQASVFSDVPFARYSEGVAATSTYVPVVQEHRLSSEGVPCQGLKSDAHIAARFVTAPPEPSGAYLAWLIIDPSGRVYPKEVAADGRYPAGHPQAGTVHNGIGLQRFGWFDRYLLAYLDGGYIPTEDAMVMGGTMAMPTTRTVKRMKPQRLFIPRQVMGAMAAAPGVRGAGYDVLEFRRGQPGYSPLCQVWVYGDPMMPVAPAALPRDAAMITSNPALNAAAAAPATYVYCLQVR